MEKSKTNNRVGNLLRFLLPVLAFMICSPLLSQVDGCKEILTIGITINETPMHIQYGDSSVTMLPFGGHAKSKYFKGDVLPGAFDTQKTFGKSTSLSARYVLEGIDCEGQKCRIFIENNATSDSQFTTPQILTDSKALSFLNNSKLIGMLDSKSGQLYIRIFMRE